jgi:hypothetical protein
MVEGLDALHGGCSARHVQSTNGIEIMLLQLGARVQCIDGELGELDNIVIRPRDRRVTHLVVAPRHHHSEARLVPIEFATARTDTDGEIELECTREVALALPATEDFAYVRLAEAPPRDGEWDVGIQRVLTVSPSVYANGQMPYPFDEDPHVSVLYDRIPPGEVEVRHESDVTAVDGVWIGHLESLTIDARGAITAMTFERGHLWRRRHITVPTSALAKVTMDGLTLALSKPQIAALEPAGRAAAL